MVSPAVLFAGDRYGLIKKVYAGKPAIHDDEKIPELFGTQRASIGAKIVTVTLESGPRPHATLETNSVDQAGCWIDNDFFDCGCIAMQLQGTVVITDDSASHLDSSVVYPNRESCTLLTNEGIRKPATKTSWRFYRDHLLKDQATVNLIIVQYLLI